MCLCFNYDDFQSITARTSRFCEFPGVRRAESSVGRDGDSTGFSMDSTWAANMGKFTNQHGGCGILHVIGDLELFFIFPYIGNIIIPTDEYFSEGLFYHQPVMFDACWCIVDVLRLIELVCGFFVVQIVDVFISEAGWTKTILKMRSSRFLDLMHIKHTLW